ncbi:hypothetical protein ARGLB_085_02520 [Arthrobacter globiformis NBRC 12137]|uniref:Integral membrane protein n=1 Tax=Arthrobacter globiformis (strain ATCC 8010 / DSM 20124 / JCM 1332 / NBRC 12137 / NCIMB 8907 / NRRL B-2979 / 168) TaxID=1077972 RepID=H0QR94_ARTG1|nr:hypothetical protein [Arthrobacter globiformis]GAB15568.1 hypothetical protein ARGLB_085_02520 [Arthrobacter globiformis NBRC 12137]
MRSFLAALAVILGLLLSAAAVPAIWVDRNIVQEDGFVALAAPLGKDPDFQKRLATAAVSSIDTGGTLPPQVAALVRPVLEKAATSLTGLPEYPAAWEETLRKSHRLNFADPASLPPEAESGTSLTLDVAPLVALAAKQISSQVGVPLEAPGQTLVNIGQTNQRQLIDRVSAYSPLGYSLAVGAGVAFLLALVTARRRWKVLAGIGVGALALSGLWTLASRSAADAVMGTASGNEMADLFKREFVAASAAGFASWTLAAAIVGAALAAAGVLARVVGGPARRR